MSADIAKLPAYIKNHIRDLIPKLDCEVLSRPALLRTDGENLTYCCDVKLLDFGELIKGVPIAAGNVSLAYALEVGCAAELTRNGLTGELAITGFSKRKPGTRKLIPVDLDSMAADPLVDVSLTVRLLSFGELKDYAGGFGFCPLGAYGVFRGGVLIEVKA